ncbi:MAG: AhpC/TSA family protein [Bacteroidaceae bacterium]|nr:AhpC/TSA family protein [Bacteroidaceae bacterium]
MKIGNILATVAAATAVLFTACTPAAPTSYTVTGILPDSSLNGKKAYLCPTTSQEVIDTTIIDGDKFIFEGVADSAMLAFLSVEGAQLYGALIVENGNITLDFTTVKEGKGPYGSGTENNRIMTEILQNLDSITPEEIKAKGMELLAKHNNDIIGVLLLTSPYYRLLDDETRLAAIEGFGEYLKNLDLVKNEEASLKGKIATTPGKPFADFEGKDIAGNPVKLSDYAGKGNYVLVDMWASWCDPCKREIPNLAEVHNLYKDKGLTVLGVFVSDDIKNLEPTMKEENITWAQIVDDERKALQRYGVSGIPAIILIGPDGTILERGNAMRGENIKKNIEKYLLGK